jgi:hypothetical protein
MTDQSFLSLFLSTNSHSFNFKSNRQGASDPDGAWLRSALEAPVAHVRRREIRRLAVERFDREPVVASTIRPLLLKVGFVAGPRRAVLRA